MATATREAYQIERADFERVLEGIRKIQAATTDELGSFDWLVGVIREVGLVPIPEAALTYAGEDDFVNASQQGLIQLPSEFAKYLLLVGEHQPSSYLEIGCFNGASASIATAYLQRRNPNLKATTIDVWPAFVFFHLVESLIPLRYVVGKTSFDLVGEKFDAVFIDGDHSFDWAWADYQNVGRHGKMCAFHDVNNAPYRDLPMGGVCGVWELVSETGPGVEIHEILEHPTHDIMGIGVRIVK